MSAADDRRTSKRVAVEYVAMYLGYGEEACQGHGEVADVSTFGARIEGCSEIPPPGARLELFFLLQEHRLPIRVEAEVVRYTDDGGFAVHFLAMDPRQKELVRGTISKLASIGKGR